MYRPGATDNGGAVDGNGHVSALRQQQHLSEVLDESVCVRVAIALQQVVLHAAKSDTRCDGAKDK